MALKKVLLVRPPRYSWPFINESDNFLLPLGLACIASAIRAGCPQYVVKIIDCPPLKIGWQSLRRLMEEEKPDIVGAGEETIYYTEAVRLFAMAKQLNPGVVTIAGGHFFSWMVDYSLGKFPVDYIVRFEGEETIVELLQTLHEGGDVAAVKGIAYSRNGAVLRTPLRPLTANLDSHPLPAFDLMPMKEYSPKGFLWQGSATLEHSRGCIDRCKFCSLWTFWGRQSKTDIEKGELEVAPFYRTKSVERTLEEIDIVYKTYNRRFIIWGDPTFNVDPKWNDAFCEGLLKRTYKDLYWWAFVRSDFVMRDERLGILEKMVRAGLINPFIGVERSCTEDLRKIGKSVNTEESVKETFQLFKRKYPSVFTQAGFVTCFPFDTRESMLDLTRYAQEIEVDYPAFQVLAPSPGTYIYQEAKENDLLEIEDFSQYDWVTPVIRSETGLTPKDFAALNMEINRRFFLDRPFWLIKGLFSPYSFKRQAHRWWFMNTIRMMWLDILDTVMFWKKQKAVTAFMRMQKPKWYDR